MKMIKSKNTIEGCLNLISKDIIEKIKNFKKYEEKKNNLIYSDIDFDDMLLFLHKNMNNEFERNRFLEYISIIPLKFFIIDFNEDKFKILPLFPFLESCFINHIEKNNCDEYFKKDRYKNFSFLSNSVKGDYFEFAVKKALIDKKIINIENLENFESIKVYEISKMDKIIENTYQDIINKLSEELDNIKPQNKKEIMEVNKIEKNKSDRIYIQLKANEKINQDKIDEKIKKGYLEHYSLKNFSNKLNEYKNVINKTEFFCLKSLDDYKYDEIEMRINKKKENIKKELKIPEEDKVFKIEISEVNEQSKAYFSGDENIFINQQNPHGKILDFACLIGTKDEKTFVGFQMKCYSYNSKLDRKFLSKADVKENLQKILLNCKDLFNCNIKKWYYYLIFYYNKDDDPNNQLSFYNQYNCLIQNIEFLFYNPKEKKFFSSNIREIKKLILSNDANLDYFTYLNKKPNYQEIELKYNPKFDNVNVQLYRDEYIKEFNQFENDLKKYGKSAEEIIKKISAIVGSKNIFYSRSDKVNEIISPLFNKLYLYSKKKSQHYIAVKRNKYGIEIYDLKQKKKLDIIDQESLGNKVNFEKRIYILTLLESINKESSNDFLKEKIAEKIKEKNKEIDFYENREPKIDEFYHLFE